MTTISNPSGMRAAGDPAASAESLLRRLPALPTVSARLLSMMGKPDSSLKEISNLIVSDAALTGEILRMSNSAMFGSRNEVRNILQALAVLGTEKVKGLACTIALRSFLGNALQIPALKRCWRHNLATAVLASEIADWARQDSGEAYTAAILHDVGRLGLIALDPATYLQVLDRAVQEKLPLCQVEEAAYGMDHAMAGEWLAKSWGLPEFITAAIRSHHGAPPVDTEGVGGLVHYSCRIADFIGFGALDEGEVAKSPDPIVEFVASLPVQHRERLNIHVGELEVLVAAHVNALEA